MSLCCLLNQRFNDKPPSLLYNDVNNNEGVIHMNLKEAFRYQNKLEALMNEAKSILGRTGNVVKIENTALRHKVNPEAEDETTVELPNTEYADQITEVAVFLLFLLDERERLSRAIRTAKQGMAMDFDGEISLNGKRQEISAIFRNMAEIRSSEHIYPGAGTGYKFNAEGNQVSYRCDLRKVTTINFDRNKVRSYAAGLSRKADEMSAELDRYLVNTQVEYEAPFDVNETFQDVLEGYIGQAE